MWCLDWLSNGRHEGILSFLCLLWSIITRFKTIFFLIVAFATVYVDAGLLRCAWSFENLLQEDEPFLCTFCHHKHGFRYACLGSGLTNFWILYVVIPINGFSCKFWLFFVMVTLGMDGSKLLYFNRMCHGKLLYSQCSKPHHKRWSCKYPPSTGNTVYGETTFVWHVAVLFPKTYRM